MECLPQEIIDKIAAHAHDDQRHLNSPRRSSRSPRPCAHSGAALACISRRWQHAYERKAFLFLQVNSTELKEFDASKIIMAHSSRLKPLSRLAAPLQSSTNVSEQVMAPGARRIGFIRQNLTTEIHH